MPTVHIQVEQEPHNPIYIYADTDFLQWPGKGTAEEPFIIEGLSINSNTECIVVNETTVNFVIRDCLLNTSTTAVRFTNVSNGQLEDCRVLADQIGIQFQNTTDCLVSGCDVISKDSGIILIDCMHCTIDNNRVFRCSYGLVIYAGQFNVITRNALFRNTVLAIQLYMSDASNNTLFMNSIGWNRRNSITNDVIDNGIDNAWDNGTVGNEWSNYCSGILRIPDTGNATDRHPVHLSDTVKPLFLEVPQEIHNMNDNSGYLLRWKAYDRFQDVYQVIFDGELVKSSNWTEREILFSLENITLGYHTIHIILVDTSGNTASNTINFHVAQPTLDPLIITTAALVSGTAVILLLLFMKSVQRRYS